MYATLKRLYQNGRISVEKLEIAVSKGWITEEQKIQITTEVNEFIENQVKVSMGDNYQVLKDMGDVIAEGGGI
jgi:hypothetical protein